MNRRQLIKSVIGVAVASPVAGVTYKQYRYIGPVQDWPGIAQVLLRDLDRDGRLLEKTRL